MFGSVLSKIRSAARSNSVAPGQPQPAPAARNMSSQDIIDAYTIMLSRPPGPDQLEYFESRIVHGLTAEQLVFTLFRTDEFEAQTDQAKAAAIDAADKRFNVRPTEDDRIAWFHSIKLSDGRITRGQKAFSVLNQEADIIFKHGVTGKSVLDIGAWDGFFSFEAERRGAASVLSTDHFCWSGPGWGTKAGYDYAHAALRSKATSVDVDLPDLDPAKLGQHNIVLFLGVLYHLKDPVRGLELAASVCDDLLVIETATALNNLNEPAARYYPGSELNGDDTNFWAPNVACLEGMLSDIGFKRVETTLHPLWRKNASGAQRHITHAWKNA